MRNHRMFVLGAGLLALTLFASACSDSGGDDDTGGATTAPEPKPELTIGVSFNGPESQLVAEMYAQVLENAGYTITREFEISERAVGNEALASGDIDLKPEYTGPQLLFYDEKAQVSGDDPQAIADALAAAVQPEGLVTYAISPANSTNVFVVTPDTAEANGLTDMTSLADVAGELTLGAPPDCLDIAFCIPGLKKTYGIEFAEYKPLRLRRAEDRGGDRQRRG